MLFREYVELLYQAYLEDRGYLLKLREKIQSEEFNKDQMYDPSFDEWKSIDLRNPDTYHGNRIKYHPSPYDPQQGVYTFEERQKARRILKLIKESIRQRQRQNAKYQEP